MAHEPLPAGDLDLERLKASSWADLIHDCAAGHLGDPDVAEVAGTDWWDWPTTVVDVEGLDGATSLRSVAFRETFMAAWSGGHRARYVVPESIARLLDDDADWNHGGPDACTCTAADVADPAVIAGIVAALGGSELFVADHRDTIYEAIVADAADAGIDPVRWAALAAAVCNDVYDGNEHAPVIVTLHDA